ncbi:uridine kinase [bacterium 1XD42-8]|jgi:uridine kinase|nr:uridine kinase [Lachnospiraceae bacterium]RKJ35635.1 uridine kinase [bacterium 1XD42-8]
MNVVAKRLIAATENFPQRDMPYLIAVDGRCGAGKTTLGKYLQEIAGWTIFHMDDFFLRPEQRTKKRLDTPGGNVDYERFLDDVLIPLKRGESDIVYRPFDCHKQKMEKPVHIKVKGICLIEGSYSCHPALWDYYDQKVFLTIDPEEQKRRIFGRNKGEGAELFIERWIPLEEQYFSAYGIEKRCDLRFKMNK